MRILHYLRYVRLEHGGVVRAVLDMVAWQARIGHDVTLVTCDDVDIPREWRSGERVPRVETLREPGLGVAFDRRFGAEADRLVKAHDVVHLHVLWDLAQIPFARACRRHRVPYVQSPHGMLADWSRAQKRAKKDLYLALYGQRLLDDAAFIVLTAQGELDQSAKRHPKTPGAVLPLVFDTDPYRECPTPELARRTLTLPDPDVPSILYLSRLHYKKRPDLVLTAGRGLRDLGRDVRLVIAGPSDPAYDAQLKDYARRLKVDDITTFTGMVPAEAKASLFHACDLFCLPTSMENFGFVYFESLACATAVVTTKGTDTWPEIEASGGGRIVDLIPSDVQEGSVGGGDVRELVGALDALVQRRDTLKPMGHRGREWVLRELDPRRVTTRYIDLYERAIAKTPR
jgi:glycosyltransferase involved in cell wall biosynthesis